MAILYLVFAICSFFATAIINKIGNIRVSLACGGLCFTFWILSFILPSKKDYLSHQFIEAVILVTAAINGFGAAILWVSQGKYITECACKENQGFYFSYFWAFYMMSCVARSVIASIVLEIGVSKEKLFLAFAVMVVLGSLILCFIKDPSVSSSF